MNNNLIEGIDNLIEYRESLEENEYAYSMELEASKDKGINLQKYFKKNYAINRKASQLSTPSELYRKFNEFSKKETFDKMVEKWLGFYNVKYNPSIVNFSSVKGDSFKQTYSEYKAVNQELKNIESKPRCILELLVPGILLSLVAFVMLVTFQVMAENANPEENMAFQDFVKILLVLAVGSAGVIPLVLSFTIPAKRRNGIIARERMIHDTIFKEYDKEYYNVLKLICLIEKDVNKDLNEDIETEYLNVKKEVFNKYIRSRNILQSDMQMQILELDKTGFDYFKDNYKPIENNIDLYNLFSKCKIISKQSNNTDSIELIKAREEAIKMLSNKEQIQPTFTYEPIKDYSINNIKSNLFNVETKEEPKNGSSLYCITCNDKDKCPHLGKPEGFCYK